MTSVKTETEAGGVVGGVVVAADEVVEGGAEGGQCNAHLHILDRVGTRSTLQAILFVSLRTRLLALHRNEDGALNCTADNGPVEFFSIHKLFAQGRIHLMPKQRMP